MPEESKSAFPSFTESEKLKQKTALRLARMSKGASYLGHHLSPTPIDLATTLQVIHNALFSRRALESGSSINECFGYLEGAFRTLKDEENRLEYRLIRDYGGMTPRPGARLEDVNLERCIMLALVYMQGIPKDRSKWK